jgi:hypothetical protein
MDPLKNLNTWLEDMTYASEYTFLEEGKDDDELSRIAKKRGITLPSHDLAIFKCKYAFTDRVNKNGCLLPAEEVAKSLSTLVGKAVDFDHFRKRICGTWIDAELKDDLIVAYGSFFKSNLQEDFNTIKDLMQKGALSVSFEAWGNKKTIDGSSYSLNDICFAGGALLLKESPAFPGADVMEMANQRVLEFAKVMTKPQTFLHTGESEKTKEKELPESARLWLHENTSIMRLLDEVECEICHTKGYHDLQNMDYVNSIGMTKCVSCGTFHKVYFTPKAEVLSSGKCNIAKVEVMANLELREDIMVFVNSYEGEDEKLDCIISNEFEGELEQAKFIKCKKCANAFEIHGNTSKCPKCGSRWEKDSETSPYEVVTVKNPDPQLAKKLSYQDRQNLKDEDFAVVVATKNKKTGKPRKIRMFPIHDPAHVHNALAHLSQATESLKKLGITQETVKNKIMKKAREFKMDELMKLHNATTVEELIQAMAKAAGAKDILGAEAVADVKAKIEQAMADEKAQIEIATKINEFLVSHVEIVKVDKEAEDAKAKEVETAKAEVAKMQNELKEATAKLEAATAEIAKFKAVEEAKAKAEIASKVQARKDELGEFAKDMKDEDVLDETKYEMAKLRKENADLKARKDKKDDEKPDLTKGSADKKVAEVETKSRAKVNELAFGRDSLAIAENLKK